MRRLCFASAFGVWWLLQAVLLVAQQSEARELTAGGFPVVRAVPVGEGPLIDGDVLNDPAYADAVLATGFVQNRPASRTAGHRSAPKCALFIPPT